MRYDLTVKNGMVYLYGFVKGVEGGIREMEFDFADLDMRDNTTMCKSIMEKMNLQNEDCEFDIYVHDDTVVLDEDCNVDITNRVYYVNPICIQDATIGFDTLSELNDAYEVMDTNGNFHYMYPDKTLTPNELVSELASKKFIDQNCSVEITGFNTNQDEDRCMVEVRDGEFEIPVRFL